MPIVIYIEGTFEPVDTLCNKLWDLPTQLDALEHWLLNQGQTLAPGSYVADIGFDIRKEAAGGGGILSSKSMEMMGALGMAVYFSEYPSAE